MLHQVNKQGLSPLHLLASKPSVFPSGLELFGIRRLFYHCVPVQKLEKLPPLAKAPNPLPNWDFHLRPWELYAYYRNRPRDPDDQRICVLPKLWSDEEELVLSMKLHVILDIAYDALIISPLQIMHTLLAYALFVLMMLIRLAKYTSGTFTGSIFFSNWIPAGLFHNGYEEYVRIKNIKKRCTWSVELTDLLLPVRFICNEGQKVESLMFTAAKHGISEMVSRILDLSSNSEAILDVDSDMKNIVMLAVEHRHTRLYDYLITNWNSKKTIFGEVDTAGNSLLHIAASLKAGKQFWRVQGVALHLQMEIKWYKFIKNSMPPHFFARHNSSDKTAKEIFLESHQHLIDESRQWLTDTSQSCSVVAALIATVAFATSAAVPGGLKQDGGVPSLEHKPFFVVSASSSLIALSSSMISVVMFLGILTSNFKVKDFRRDLPYKLLLGLISLLISIVSMFISFFAGHYFVLKQELHHSATLVYVLLCSSLLVFIIAKFPLGFEILWTTLRSKPQN